VLATAPNPGGWHGPGAVVAFGLWILFLACLVGFQVWRRWK
jgi:uncharacterized protein YybS (DUF2232 family)